MLFQPVYRSDLCDAVLKQEWPVENRTQKKQKSLLQLPGNFGGIQSSELSSLGSERQSIKRQKGNFFSISAFPPKFW